MIKKVNGKTTKPIRLPARMSEVGLVAIETKNHCSL